jgi:hypothetical protein
MVIFSPALDPAELRQSASMRISGADGSPPLASPTTTNGVLLEVIVFSPNYLLQRTLIYGDPAECKKHCGVKNNLVNTTDTPSDLGLLFKDNWQVNSDRYMNAGWIPIISGHYQQAQ